jgi:hypothetical protein
MKALSPPTQHVWVEGSAAEAGMRRDLAALVLDRSVTRIRDEAETLIAELHQGDDVRRHLSEMDTLLPLPQPVVEVRNRVADGVVAQAGGLPGDIV